jgi:diguanylate cyclase (GGDEF)-like protein/PAS domain S-box-containing protein
MVGLSGSSADRRWVIRLRKYGYGAHLGICFLAVALAASAVLFGFGRNLLWIANGVLLSFLLLTSRRRWPVYWAAGFAAQLVVGALAGRAWQTNLLETTLNLLEVGIAFLLLRGRSKGAPLFSDHLYLFRFVEFGVLSAPAVAALVTAVALRLWPQFLHGFTAFEWFASDALGIAMATPVCVAILQGRFQPSTRPGAGWLFLPFLGGVTLAAFTQAGAPLLFAIYPLLALILLQMGIRWAATAMLFVAAVSGWATFHDQGPLVFLGGFGSLPPSLQLQFFIASGVFMLYSFSIVMAREAVVRRQLEEIASLHALVSENSRDAIIVADLSGHRSYGSAAAASITGWKPEELMTAEGIELIHPDDRDRAQTIMGELKSGAEGAMIECRVRKEDGGYLWVEASLRLVKGEHDGEPSRMLNIVRDISQHKEAERKLQQAYDAVEALAVTDALTGLANRRHFDQYLATEWRRSARDRQPLSLIMMDVDQFKLFNDSYGHVRGDGCLKQIAEACMDVVSRPGDLVARFGGEEFVVILPNTDNYGAVKVAQEICDSVSFRRLPHASSTAGVVTISLGCATLIPRFGKHTYDLIESADRALYRAKELGRNRVCNASDLPDSEETIDDEISRHSSK